MFEIGNNLKEARLRRRVDLMDAENATKIRSKYLAALETEDFDILPGPVYARGFLRTYARFLGLNPQLYIDEYNARFGRFEDDDEPVLGRGPNSPLTPRTRVSLRSMLMLSLLALAAVAWFGLHDSRPTVKHDRPVSASIRTTTTDASFLDRHEPIAPAAGAVATPVAAPTTAQLLIKVDGGSSWIEVRRGSATGKVVFSGIMAAGSRKHVGGGQRLFVAAGAPSVVKLVIPGVTSKDATVRGTGSQRMTWLVSPTQIRVSR